MMISTLSLLLICFSFGAASWWQPLFLIPCTVSLLAGVFILCWKELKPDKADLSELAKRVEIAEADIKRLAMGKFLK
jgi:hypothetical protein